MPDLRECNRAVRSLVYYITAHGYGHGVRSTDIIRFLIRTYPGIPVVIVSDLPRSFLRNRLPGLRFEYRSASLDTGMVQIDSIRVDVDRSLEKALDLHRSWKRLVDREAEFLSRRRAGAVVVDIPAIPLEAAARIGISGLAVSNFGWDWIYAEFTGRNSAWQTVVEAFAAGYSTARLLLRLPFHEEMSAFPSIEDIPLVSAAGSDRRREIAEITGCDPQRRWILLSFTTLDWDARALGTIESIRGYEFFTVLPLAWELQNVHALDRERVSFTDIVASVDAVISKPGYGIVSDCVVNRKPLIYAERSDFREYGILEEAIGKYLRSVRIPADDLYRGDLLKSLETIWEAPESSCAMSHGGEKIAARRIVELGPWLLPSSEAGA
ncbi:MAG: hypothetical protein HXY20_09495 [Acidobacteria bacterium]|nr:hypothetical protein [Acidobacteriota bacterium]